MGKRGRPRHPDVLTPREWEVLALVREGLTNEQIAERLGVTLHAARYHVSEILSKLGVATREEAAAWQPEKVRAGPRWSIAFQIWLTAAAAVTLIGVSVLVWGVARGSGDDESQGLIITSASPSVSQQVATATPIPTFVTTNEPYTGPNVSGMQLVNEGFAVVNASGAYTPRLYTTALVPQGERLVPQVNIAPPGIANMGDFWFLDREHGWVVSSGRRDDAYETQVSVYRTSDGGQSWSSAPMGEPISDIGDRPSVSIDFINSNRGWILERSSTSTQSSYGVLYRTDDGGATWTKLPAPSGESIRFTDENTGWQTSGGGIKGNRTLWVTRDGGTTWSDAFPSTHPPQGLTLYDLPAKLQDGSLLLPTTDPTGRTLSASRSTDEGATWTLIASAPPIPVDGPLVPYIFPDGRVVAVAEKGVDGVALPAGSNQFLQFSVTGLTGAIDVQFVDDDHGWALIYGCLASGDQCKERLWPNYIEQTDNGGKTWYPR
jgi:DNA-binding CsgD family transcriptional regulator/photosystem II stability/assembly factor-like uncharacterized protein